MLMNGRSHLFIDEYTHVEGNPICHMSNMYITYKDNEKDGIEAYWKCRHCKHKRLIMTYCY